MQPGDIYKLTRPTHLRNGILINQNSRVEVKEQHGGGNISVIYTDAEGNPIVLNDIKPSELAKI